MSVRRVEHMRHLEDRHVRLEERHTRNDERLANVEHEQMNAARRFDAIDENIKRLQAAIIRAIDALGDKPGKNTIGFKPSGNSVSPAEAARLEHYYQRTLAGQQLSAPEAQDFSRLAQKAKAEHPNDRSLAAVAALAGFAIGLLGVAILAGESPPPRRKKARKKGAQRR